MKKTLKGFATIASTLSLGLAFPAVASAQPAAQALAPQGVTIEIVTEYFGIQVTICIGQHC